MVTIILIVIAASWARWYLPSNANWAKWIDSIGDALLILLAAIIWLSYHFFFEWLWDGQTPGKRWSGLRVLQSDGMPAGLWPIAIRNILRTVDFLPFGYAVGGATALLSSHNRRIGDMVAGTIVAREKHEAGQRVLDINQAADAFLFSFNTPQTASAMSNTGAAVVATSVSSPAISSSVVASNVAFANASNTDSNLTFSPPTTPILPKLSDEERELLTSFLQRRDKLRPEPRARLAHSLATRLSTRLKITAPNREESEAFLTTLLMALHQQE